MVSDRLLQVIRCPRCRSAFQVTPAELICTTCGHRYARSGEYLDLRPDVAFTDTTKYLDPELHADARHERVSPPLLSAAIRNDMLRSFLAPSPGDRIVDLGCGSGRVLVWNRDAGAYQVGVDVSPFFAEEALAGIDLIIGDLRRLPVADATFTKGFSLDVAEHLTRESLIEMLTEAARVLTPDGALFVYSHVRKNSPLAVGLRLVNRIARYLDRIGIINLSQERLRKSDHLNPLADVDDLEAVVKLAGFRIARIRYYTPLVGAVIENLLVRIAEGMLARRAGKRAPSSSKDNADGLRSARLEGKRRIAARGPTWAVLKMLTALMKLDIILFGRVRSGPFFALLVKDPAAQVRGPAA